MESPSLCVCQVHEEFEKAALSEGPRLVFAHVGALAGRWRFSPRAKQGTGCRPKQGAMKNVRGFTPFHHSAGQVPYDIFDAACPESSQKAALERCCFI